MARSWNISSTKEFPSLLGWSLMLMTPRSHLKALGHLNLLYPKRKMTGDVVVALWLPRPVESDVFYFEYSLSESLRVPF